MATAGPKPKVAVVKSPASAGRPAGVVPAAAAAAASPRGSVIRNRRKKNSPLLFILSGVGLLFAVLLVVFVMAMNGGGGTNTVTDGGDKPPIQNPGGQGPRPFPVPEDSGGSPPETGGGPQNNPGGSSDFPEIGSESPNDPVGPRRQTFDEHIMAVRESIAARGEKTKTDELLRDARRLARSRGERDQLDHAQAIHSYVEQFWQDVFRGAMKLHRLKEDEEGRIFAIGDVEYEFLELNRGQVRMQVDGSRESWKLRELPVREAMYLSNQGRRNAHDSQVFQAAFLLLDAERENDLPLEIRRTLARVLYQNSAPTLGPNQFLDRELKDAGLDPIAYVPAEDRTPPNNEDEPSEEETAGDDDPDEEETAGNGSDPETPSDEPGKDDPDVASNPDGEPSDGESSEEEIAEDDPRWPMPEGAVLAAAATAVAEEIRGDLSAASRSDEVKAQLIRNLMLRASNENDQAKRYAYLERGRDLAIGMGNAQLLVEVIAEVGKSFRIDVLAEQANDLRACGLKIESPEAYNNFVETICDLCLAAIKAEREDVLTQACSVLESTANRLRVATQRAQATSQWFAEYARILPQIEEARATLEESPEDPTANQTLGIFLCFFQENWKDGRPLLEKAQDATLRQLAVEDAEPPADADPRAALADRWMHLATQGGYGTAISQSMVRHALWHYGIVKNKLRGRERTDMERKIGSLRSELDRVEAHMPRS